MSRKFDYKSSDPNSLHWSWSFKILLISPKWPWINPHHLLSFLPLILAVTCTNIPAGTCTNIRLRQKVTTAQRLQQAPLSSQTFIHPHPKHMVRMVSLGTKMHHKSNIKAQSEKNIWKSSSSYLQKFNMPLNFLPYQHRPSSNSKKKKKT